MEKESAPTILKFLNSARCRWFLASLFLLFVFFAQSASAASLGLSPASGTFTVGSTFTVTVFLNTESDTVNTVGTTITYPPDKLQLVSPSTGNSIISLWTAFPKVDNKKGMLVLQGGIPGGIKTSSGAVTTLTFRVNSVGTAVVKFTDDSKVLLNDGLGTDALRQVTNGVYTLVLPPPAGPVVSSDTHPDQSRWYAAPSVVLRWANEQEVDGYSYVLSDSPSDIPDDISEGLKNAVTYKNLSDGTRYFHIKSLKNGNWGGATHFAIKVDATPPAEFPIELIPDARTSRRQPIVQFASTDNLSGIAYYELKLIPLSPQTGEAANNQPLYIEVTSPYVLPELSIGNYDVLVRAHDIAGNTRESSARLSIVTPLFTIVQDEGLRLRGGALVPWVWLWGILAGAVLVVGLFGWRVRRWHHRIIEQRVSRELPGKVQEDLEELRRFRAKFGKVACLLLGAILLSASVVFAQPVSVTPPLVKTMSRDISNEDIFYVGGKTDTAGSQVVLYLQNVTTGETITEVVTSDSKGEWFYRHSDFLSSGNYLLWAQNKVGEQMSPPSPQEQIRVRTTAIRLGASRLSLETINFAITGLAVLALLIVSAHAILHAHRGRKQRELMFKEIREAEEAVRRGFAVLRRDIQAELEIIHKVKMEKSLSEQEKEKEAQLMKDLVWVEGYIGKEIWDIDKLESRM